MIAVITIHYIQLTVGRENDSEETISRQVSDQRNQLFVRTHPSTSSRGCPQYLTKPETVLLPQKAVLNIKEEFTCRGQVLVLVLNDCPLRDVTVDSEQGGSGTAQAPDTIAGDTISNLQSFILYLTLA